MHVVTAKEVDELLLNIQLAKSMSKDVQQLHVVKGQLGYRVRVDLEGGTWRMINFRNPILSSNIELLLGIKVTEDNGVFHATIPGRYIYAKADDRALAVALAASKAPLNQGELAAAL